MNTAKELYAVAYIRDDLRAVVIKMSQQLTSPTAPRELVIQARQLSEEEARELPEQIPWDEQLIRAGLHLFISLLPVEHTLQGEQNVECGDSLLHHLARMTATAINDVKRVSARLPGSESSVFPGYLPLHRPGHQVDRHALGDAAGHDRGLSRGCRTTDRAYFALADGEK